MVRYNGRNKLLTTAVNGNQIGLKMSGNAPSVGRAISTRRYTKRRVRDNLKYCGPVYYRGQLWSFNGDNCVEKAPLRQSSAGGVGHINHPRKKCNISCSVDNCDICEAIKLIRQYFIHRFGEDGIVLVAPQETLQSDGINDVINGEKIYHFDSNHAEYYSLPRKVRDAVDAVNNLKLKYRLKDSPEKIVHIVGYIAPSLQKTLREKFFGNYEETFGSGANEETLYGFGYGFSYYNLWSIIALFRNNGYTQGINYKGEHFATLNELSRVPFLAIGSLQRLFQDDHLIGGSQAGQIQAIMEMDQWDTSNVTEMNYMFSGASNFNGEIGGWNTGKVQLMQNMFQNATSFNGSYIVSWNTSNVTDMSHMFDGATNFNQDFGRWNTSNVTDMSYMFSGASNFNGEIGGWNTKNVTDMSHMFRGASKFNQYIGGWDTSNVTDMSSMFDGASTFNKDISGWNIRKVTNMSGMFRGASKFNQDIASGWDTWNVTDMSYMFNGASDFNKNLNSLFTSKVTNMSGMFLGAIKFNENIRSWDTSNVTDMSSMFNGAFEFNQYIADWNTSNVTNMSSMFEDAYEFNQDIGDWKTSNVTNMSSMFRDASDFNQNISGWDVSRVTTMNRMFGDDCFFNQNIRSWNTKNVTNYEDFSINMSSQNLPIFY